VLTQGIDFRMEFGIHKTNLIHVAVISMYLNMLLCTHAVRGGGRRDTLALTPSVEVVAATPVRLRHPAIFSHRSPKSGTLNL
jgi:hypothetical protein